MACKSCLDLSNNNETEWKSLQRYSCDDSLLRCTPPLIPQKLTNRGPVSTHTYNDHDGEESVTDSLITNGQPVCRVCFEYGAEPLYSPCKCDGSAKYIHEGCMLTWFHKTRRKSCEICLSKINIKSTGCKPLVKWRIPKGTYNFVFYFYIIYALATFSTSGIAFSVAVTERCTTPTCIALYIACILSVLSLVYCAGFTIYIKMFWKAALTTNRNWKVYDRISHSKSDKPLIVSIQSSEDQGLHDVREAFKSSNVTVTGIGTASEDRTLFTDVVLVHTERNMILGETV